MAGRAADLISVSPDTNIEQWRTAIKGYAVDHGAQAVDEGGTVHVEIGGQLHLKTQQKCGAAVDLTLQDSDQATPPIESRSRC